MYLQYGTDAIARLNGMFAFVLYDSRQGNVVAARDHFGIKPLYVCRRGTGCSSPPRSRRCSRDFDVRRGTSTRCRCTIT